MATNLFSNHLTIFKAKMTLDIFCKKMEWNLRNFPPTGISPDNLCVRDPNQAFSYLTCDNLKLATWAIDFYDSWRRHAILFLL